jgi:alkanesulfonate monooxygenase
MVTTSNPDASIASTRRRTCRALCGAREFYRRGDGPSDNWANDAFLREAEAGVYFDAELHVLNNKGKYLSMRGPFNIAQDGSGLAGDGAGWYVRGGQAGRRRDRRGGACGAANMQDEDRAFYQDVKGRAERAERDPEHLKILRRLHGLCRRFAGRSTRVAGVAPSNGALCTRNRLAVVCKYGRKRVRQGGA